MDGSDSLPFEFRPNPHPVAVDARAAMLAMAAKS